MWYEVVCYARELRQDDLNKTLLPIVLKYNYDYVRQPLRTIETPFFTLRIF